MEKSLTILPKLPKEEFERLLKLWREENQAVLKEIDPSRLITDVIRAEGGKNLFRLRMLIE
jgi:hypothetical protein